MARKRAEKSKKSSKPDPKVGGKSLRVWRRLLADKNPDVRRRAATALERLGRFSAKAAPLLNESLQDGDAQVREQAALALGNARSAAAVPPLVRALRDRQDGVRNAAAIALERLGPAAESAVPALILALSDKAAQHNAVRALGSIGPAAESALPALVQMMHAPGDTTAGWIAGSMQKIGPAALPYLMDLLLAKDDELRSAAVSALGRLGPVATGAAPEMAAAMLDKSCSWRAQAARVLGMIDADPRIAIPAFLAALDDDNDDVRSAATQIGRYGAAARKSVPRLRKLLAGSFPGATLNAMRALGDIGPAAAAALPDLRPLLQHKDRTLRQAARMSIAQIVGSAPAPAPAPTKVTGNIFDFARTRAVVAEMIQTGIAEFAEEHPGVSICCVGLFGSGFGGSASLCLETPEHSAAECEKTDNSYSIGKDSQGRFFQNVYEFEFKDVIMEVFDFWPDLYEVGSNFTILMPNGKKSRRSTDKNGNDAIDRPLFQLLVDVLKEAPPFQALRIAEPFRLGVDMDDSTFRRCWLYQHPEIRYVPKKGGRRG